MIEPSVTTSPDPAVIKKAFRQYQRAMRNKMPIWRKLAGVISKEMSENIKSEGTRSGTIFPERKEIKNKLRYTTKTGKSRMRSTKLLQRTGLLVKSMKNKKQHTLYMKKTHLTVGPKPLNNETRYFVAMASGVPKKNIPARNFARLTPNMLAEFEDLYQSHVQKAIGKFNWRLSRGE